MLHTYLLTLEVLSNLDHNTNYLFTIQCRIYLTITPYLLLIMCSLNYTILDILFVCRWTSLLYIKYQIYIPQELGFMLTVSYINVLYCRSYITIVYHHYLSTYQSYTLMPGVHVSQITIQNYKLQNKPQIFFLC